MPETYITEEQRAAHRVINSIYTDGMDPKALRLIDKRVKGINLPPELNEYLANAMLADPRLCEHYQLEMMLVQVLTEDKE